MIYSSLTKNFFGINLFGDFNDLERLHRVIHHCADGYGEKSSARQHLHDFAYEIRHAKQGDRERKVLEANPGEKNIYYGVGFPLPYYVLSINLMQNSFATERRLHQTATIWDLVSDLQETAVASGSAEFVQSVEYWIFNTLLNQARIIPGENLMSATRDKDHLTILADYAVHKFISITPKQRLTKLGFVMNFIHPWTEDSKKAILELTSKGKSPEEGDHLEFTMPDLKEW